MKDQNILILSPFYPPNIGGAETFAKGLAENLSKNNFVTVLAFKSFDGKGQSYSYDCYDELTKNDGWECRGDLEVMRMEWGFKMGKAWSGTGIMNFFRIVPKMLWEAIRICRVRKFDVVYCNGLNSALVGAILKVFFKVRVGCILLALYEWKGMFGSIAKRVLKRMDKVFVEGIGGALNLIPIEIGGTKVKIFHHWVDQDIFKPDQELRKYKCLDNIKVLFVGRPIAEKGISLVKQCEVRLKGEVDFEYIENVPHEDLPKHYQMADVLVVPSLYNEGFVRVVAEGSSCGCAIITSDRGSLSEMTKDFGLQFDAKDYHGLLDLIEMLNSNRVMLINQQQLALEYAKKNFNESNAGVFSSICSY